jgi:serine protease Do
VRAYLGVRLDRHFDSAKAIELGIPQASGARVTDITPNSPAEIALLKVGDVIMKVDGLRVEDDDHLVNLISLKPVGKEVELLVYRSGKPFVVRVRVGDRDQFEPE